MKLRIAWLLTWIKNHRNLSISIAIHLCLIIAIIVAVPTAVREYHLSGSQAKIISATIVQEAKPVPVQSAAAKREKEVAAEKRKKAHLEEIRVAKLKKERLKKERLKKAQLIKKKQALAKKRKAAKALAEKKADQKAAHEAKLKEQAMQALLQKISSEQKAAAAQAAYQQKLLTDKQKYIALVTQIIRANWINQFSGSDYQVTLKIDLDAKGDVESVNVVKSSGNSAFDRQAQLAVQKSSPLPVPQQKPLQHEMQSMTLAFSNLS